ncbi:thioredoxin family protein [Hydrogenivirga sp.]
MRLAVFLLLVILGAVVWASRWYPDFHRGVEVARQENKLVMVYLYENGCNYCKYMEDVVFIDPKVSDIMERVFVVVPVNVEDIPEDLDRRFRSLGTPTFFIYDPKRDKLLMQIFGMQEADEFYELLTDACKKYGMRRC